MVLRGYGNVVLWVCGTVVLWFYGTLGWDVEKLLPNVPSEFTYIGIHMASW